jgi:hypothetical protein
MQVHPCLRVLSAFLVMSALGCATASRGPASPSDSDLSCKELLGQPASLLAQGRAALEQKQPELAYRYLALLQTLHPGSPESQEAFPLAASLFKGAYRLHRYSDPDSVWLTSEPVFMFQWLARFFEGEFPQEQMEALFTGMNYGLVRDFSAFAASRPKLAQWELQVEKDNGIVESIRGVRAEQALR